MAFPRVVVTPVSNSRSKGLAWWWHEGRVDRCPSLRAPVLFDQRADRRVPIRQLTESGPRGKCRLGMRPANSNGRG